MNVLDAVGNGFGSITGDDMWRSVPPAVRVWEPDRELIVLGRGGNPDRDCHVETCELDGIPIVRRTTGGGAVFLGPGILCIGLLLPRNEIDPHGYYRPVLKALMTVLGSLGLRRVSSKGVSDLAVGNKKIFGSTLAIRRSGVLFLASLILTDIRDRAEKYLKLPARQPEYRANRSHREFLVSWDLRDRIGSIREEILEELNRSISRSPAFDREGMEEFAPVR
jgi:lipoate-protein ligase A